MQEGLTVQRCLARADRLRMLADGAADYRDMLTYEELATEWLVLAGRLAALERAPVASPQPLTFTLRRMRGWFRFLETLGQTSRLK